MKRVRYIGLAVAAVIGMAVGPTTFAQAVDEHASEHARVVAFWTPQRVAQAVPRDYVREAGRPVPVRKPGGGDTTSVLGASWGGGGAVLQTTGKVLFAMGSGYYVCSASAVTDKRPDRSVLLTAGHCVVDENTGAFATNWMFVPDYDSAPASLSTDGSFCEDTAHGCWVADVLVASKEFAEAGGFTDEATLHDYAFAVVSDGGTSGNEQLDAVVGAQPVQFTVGAPAGDTSLFGYPAAGRYHGADLVYSRGPLGYDALVGNQTYRVASSMTGGSSGGPWFQGFDANSGTGRIMSVTSYGYSGQKALFGPQLTDETEDMLGMSERADLDGPDQLG